MTLSKTVFLARLAEITMEYQDVMNEGQRGDNNITVDGSRLLAVIEALAELITEMHEQMTWPPENLNLPYN